MFVTTLGSKDSSIDTLTDKVDFGFQFVSSVIIRGISGIRMVGMVGT